MTCAWLVIVYFFLSEATSITLQTIHKLPHSLDILRSLVMLREFLWLLNWLSVLGPICGLVLGLSVYHWQNTLKQSDIAQH
ncbi:MAG: hypothetical protein VKK59_02860, partial [Vampirovibrionales bacterium]|nr:hypothetical protein [Vampirovibrionales bacterium]